MKFEYANNKLHVRPIYRLLLTYVTACTHRMTVWCTSWAICSVFVRILKDCRNLSTFSSCNLCMIYVYEDVEQFTIGIEFMLESFVQKRCVRCSALVVALITPWRREENVRSSQIQEIFSQKIRRRCISNPCKTFRKIVVRHSNRQHDFLDTRKALQLGRGSDKWGKGCVNIKLAFSLLRLFSCEWALCTTLWLQSLREAELIQI